MDYDTAESGRNPTNTKIHRARRVHWQFSDTARNEMDDTPHAPRLMGATPPTYEQFLIKDLDTAMKTFVTDQEWVEQPLVPTPLQPAMPPSAERKMQSQNFGPLYAPEGVDRPPPNPHAAAGRALRHPQKRAHSDAESAPRQRMLRPVDHMRVTAHKKRERDRDFGTLYRWQRVHAHRGAIRALEFNLSGSFLASAGADTVVKIWQIDCNLEDSRSPVAKGDFGGTSTDTLPRAHSAYVYIRQQVPPVTCCGHTADVTDLSWSKNDFLLSGSVDRTIRLWHPRSKSCLRRLLHADIVTSVAFHPTDEQICIAGTSDGLVNMWHLKERKMLSQADAADLITAIAITPDGTTALVGTHHGRCKIFALFDEIQAEWQFKHMTQLDVRSKKARNGPGKKICGFRFYGKGDKVLLSSNDSRLRLYRLDDKSVVSKFTGCQNNEARFNGSFDPTGRFMLCASELRSVHIWDMVSSSGDTSAETRRASEEDEEEGGSGLKRKDVGVVHESFMVQETGQVTGAVFAPHVVPAEAMYLGAPVSNGRTSGLVMVTASDDGDLRVFGCC